MKICQTFRLCSRPPSVNTNAKISEENGASNTETLDKYPRTYLIHPRESFIDIYINQ